jgi:peptidoglycan/LPS O-acetylase OafA/YrhL
VQARRGEAHAAPGLSGPQRIEALDALRAAAMLAGVVLHACAPYMHAPMRNLLVPLPEPAATRLPDVIFWVIHAVRLPAFFFVSGFLSLRMLRRRGPQTFLNDRARRILIPLALTCVIILPVMYFIWSWGWTERGWASWRHVFFFHFGPDIERNLFGLYHLWFLEYLFIHVLLMWAIARTPPLGQWVAPLSRLWLAILLPLGALCAASDTSWFLDFHNGFLPQAHPLIYFGLFFAWGAAASARVESGQSLVRLTRLWPTALVAAAAGAYFLLALVLPSTRMSPHGLCEATFRAMSKQAWQFGALLTITAAASTWAAVGGLLMFLPRLGRVGRYLADASYWVYLTHLVWVGLCVMALHWLPWIPELKALVVMCVAAAGTLSTFALIRRTRLHGLIGTRLHASTAPAPASTPAPPQTTAEVHSSQP